VAEPVVGKEPEPPPAKEPGTELAVGRRPGPEPLDGIDPVPAPRPLPVEPEPDDPDPAPKPNPVEPEPLDPVPAPKPIPVEPEPEPRVVVVAENAFSSSRSRAAAAKVTTRAITSKESIF
jgi:hypothetical protein